MNCEHCGAEMPSPENDTLLRKARKEAERWKRRYDEQMYFLVLMGFVLFLASVGCYFWL